MPAVVTVTCLQCRASAEADDPQSPDRSLMCACCPLDHDHAGLGCRPVHIHATAELAGEAF